MNKASCCKHTQPLRLNEQEALSLGTPQTLQIPRRKAQTDGKAARSPGTVMAAIAAAALRLQEVAERIAGGDPPTDPVALLELEQELHRCVARECIDPITEAVLQVVVESDSVIERAAALVASYDSLYLQKSAQSVRIMLLGGSEVTVVTPYYLLRPKRRPGRRRGKGRRGAEGNGVYPRLAVVGIHYRVSPALASEVARLFTLGTVTESLSHLAVRGIQIDCKKLCRLSQRLAERGLAYRDWLMKKCLAGERRGTSAKGKRLVLGVDGGRLRTRVNNGGRPKKSGRRGFDAEWREPKVLVIYEVDAKGRKVRDGLLWYDATLKNADAVFEILAAHLINLGAQETAEWIFISDVSG